MCARLPERPTRDDRRVLAEDQGGPFALAEVVDEPALEVLDILELDQAEQVDLQRGPGRRRHRWLVPSRIRWSRSWSRSVGSSTREVYNPASRPGKVGRGAGRVRHRSPGRPGRPEGTSRFPAASALLPPRPLPGVLAGDAPSPAGDVHRTPRRRLQDDRRTRRGRLRDGRGYF